MISKLDWNNQRNQPNAEMIVNLVKEHHEQDGAVISYWVYKVYILESEKRQN